jgi:hypothetical protein
MNARELTLWLTLLSRCEGRLMDLSEMDSDVLPLARRMADTGLLLETMPQTYTLTTRGLVAKCAVEKFAEFSLTQP